MKTGKQVFAWLASLWFAVLLVGGCATNYQGLHKYTVKKYDYQASPKDRSAAQANALFKKIAGKNQLIADQVAQLPAFSRGIDQGDLKALRVIYQTINGLTFPAGFPHQTGPDKAVKWLACITEGGLPMSKKKYNSFLEAWVWLIKQGKFRPECVGQGLCGFGNLPKRLDKCKFYRDRLIYAAWGDMEGEQWSNFDVVTARLNTPELMDLYQRRNFLYAATFQGYGCGGVDISGSTDVCRPDYIFETQRGNCAAYTTFAVYALRKAGYEAHPVKVVSHWPASFAPGAMIRDYHYLTLYKDHGKWYILDDGRGGGPRGISGPYDKPQDMPYKILHIEWVGR